MASQMVEDALRYIFLPSLFQGGTSYILGRAIPCLPVKQDGIALPEPTRTVRAIWMASCVITGNLAAELRRTAESRSGEHALLMGEVRGDIRQRHGEEVETAL